MNNKLKYLIFLFLTPLCYTQHIENISFEEYQNKILIYYDLIGEKDDEYEISLVLKREEYSGFIFIPKTVEGDIGKGNYAGRKKKIIWDVSKDYHIDPEVEDFYFEVSATKLGGIPWYYYVGGTAVAGGLAAILLMKKDEGTTRIPIKQPPDRP